jgi:hypothetical protein
MLSLLAPSSSRNINFNNNQPTYKTFDSPKSDLVIKKREYKRHLKAAAKQESSLATVTMQEREADVIESPKDEHITPPEESSVTQKSEAVPMEVE